MMTSRFVSPHLLSLLSVSHEVLCYLTANENMKDNYKYIIIWFTVVINVQFVAVCLVLRANHCKASCETTVKVDLGDRGSFSFGNDRDKTADEGGDDGITRSPVELVGLDERQAALPKL